MEIVPIIVQAKEKFTALVRERGLGGEMVSVKIGTLSPQQAIGDPGRPDFALLGGKEVMIEADFRGSFGQAFTNQPQSYDGHLEDVLALNLDSTNDRAIFVATLNAVISSLGMVTGVRHCRNEEPEKCGGEIANHILKNYGRVKVGMVGYQPAILDHLAKTLGVSNVKCSDLDAKNIGSLKFGVEIADGKTENPDLISWCDILLITSSTSVNDTFDELRDRTVSQGKRLITFGVTGAGISALFGWIELPVCTLEAIQIMEKLSLKGGCHARI